MRQGLVSSRSGNVGNVYIQETRFNDVLSWTKLPLLTQSKHNQRKVSIHTYANDKDADFWRQTFESEHLFKIMFWLILLEVLKLLKHISGPN